MAQQTTDQTHSIQLNNMAIATDLESMSPSNSQMLTPQGLNGNANHLSGAIGSAFIDDGVHHPGFCRHWRPPTGISTVE